MIRRLINARLTPGGALFRVVSAVVSAAARLGLDPPAHRVPVLDGDGFDLIMTPLGGSSTVNAATRFPLKADLDRGKTIYMLARSDADRAQSFYNKKVRNPDNLGKCRLLAKIPDMRHDMSEDAFVDAFLRWRGVARKDKHMLSTAEILAQFDLKAEDVRFLSLAHDKAEIEALVGPLGAAAKTTEEVAGFQPPVRLSDANRERLADV